MNETERLFETFKRCLRAKGITYGGRACKLNLRESSVKRLFAEGSFSMERLERVCRAMDMSIADLVRMAGGPSTTPVPKKDFTLSLEQGRILAGDSSLLAFFYLLFNGHPPDVVAERLDLSKRPVANSPSRRQNAWQRAPGFPRTSAMIALSAWRSFGEANRGSQGIPRTP